MSCQDAIGVFDSGLGGLSAVKEFLHVLPNEKIIYFGDTGRVPYGNRSRETISKYALQDANFLLKHNVKTVVAACGTVSSVAGDMLEEKLSVPYTGVVNPTAFIADRKTKNGKIGIIGTAATISSHSYKLRLEKLNPKYKVYEQACPLFVPLVENGFICHDDQIVRLVIRRYLSELKETGVDTLILGCTHYPLLLNKILKYTPRGVKIVPQGEYVSNSLKDYFVRHPDIEAKCTKNGLCHYLTTENTDKFRESAQLFLHERVDVENITLG